MSVRSMTGFARVRRQTDDGEITVTLKSVNHRGLDIHFHMGSALDPFENPLRTAIKKKVARGHVEVRVAISRVDGDSGFSLNRPLLEAYLGAFRAAAAEHGIVAEPDLNAAFRVPGMLEESGVAEMPEKLGRELEAAMDEALDTLNAFREREGGEIAVHLLARNVAIREAAARLKEIRTRALPAFHARLTERLGELLQGVAVEPQRLAQEAAMLADRSDVHEELDRLEIHSQQLEQVILGGNEVGKKLDFLLQEMNRETNTVLSKTSGIGEPGLGVTELALSVKSDIEKIREQALNLE